ncbi:hypothetical protein J4Q44_G00109670 [Coregonus suidteri]|uniref:Uncharacterized protein n=1 Tax=Coregonus suidteri TaxID=861788 RepID=A0AAN8QZ58_9TELE
MNLPLHVVLSSNRDRQGKQLPDSNKTTSFVEVYSPDRSDMQQRRSPYAFGSATNYQTDNVESKDDSVSRASREEPSSTVEEVETKSYNGQNSEESPREELNEDNFHDQMKRELSYREEMFQQLHIVREAPDARHHFSCKMLTPRHYTGTCSSTTLVPSHSLPWSPISLESKTTTTLKTRPTVTQTQGRI